MARFNYKGHDIYVKRANTRNILYEVSVDGKTVGMLDSVCFMVNEECRANQKDESLFKALFTPTSDLCRLPDGSELSMKASLKLTGPEISAAVNGQPLVHEQLHDRSLGDLRRVSQNYEQLGRLTDEQFLALKSLSEPVILQTGHIKTQAGKFMPIPYIDELQSQKSLNGEGNLRSNRFSDIRPGEHVFFDMRSDHPILKLPSELYLNGKTSYVNRVEATVKEVYRSRNKDENVGIKRNGMFTRPYTIEGQISVYGKDGPHTVNGVFTNVDYRDEASKYRNELYSMTPEQRMERMEAIRNVVEGVTLAEYATIRDLRDKDITITEELLIEIASKDGQWQLDREAVQNMSLEQDNPVMSIDELEEEFNPSAPIIDGDGNQWEQMTFGPMVFEDVEKAPDQEEIDIDEQAKDDFDGPELD